MNQKNREQLRAAILDNLAQGKQAHSPTRDLLKQYRPLKGILTSVPEQEARPEAISSAPSDGNTPVEKSMAGGATVAQSEPSPWHAATVAPAATAAPSATVESYAEVKGELRVPNTISFGLFPTLDPFAKAVYYQLYLLAHGFKREICTIGLAKLAKSVLMSQRKVQDTICYLEKRKLIERVGANLGGSSKGNVYRVFVPNTLVPGATVAAGATLARPATLAPSATNKDDDDLEIQSSSKRAHKCPVENSSHSALVQGPTQPEDFRAQRSQLASTREIYCQVTGNKWTEADLAVYEDNRIDEVPIEQVVSAIQAVAQRTPVKINSFNYFVKEILARPDLRNRAFQKKRLEKIVRRVRESHIGKANYSSIDFVADVKAACAQESLQFDNDLFNELCR
jgi:hypothetical protein